VLRWVEEYASRLEQGWYAAEPLSGSLDSIVGISLFPKQPPQLCSEVTRGCRVRASSLYVPEKSRAGAHLFTYCIRFRCAE
jgi:hypothetical protein